MAGGPSHCDTFDYKPELEKINDKAFPETFTKGQQLAQLQAAPLIARGSYFKFAPQGQSGTMISSVFPEISKLADEIAVVTEQLADLRARVGRHRERSAGLHEEVRLSRGELTGLDAEIARHEARQSDAQAKADAAAARAAD